MEKDWKNLGDQILGSVADALNSGDFSQLNDLVSGTVNNVVQEAKRQAEQKKAAEDDFIRFAQENAESREKWERQQEEIRRRQEERREEWRNRQQQRINREAEERREAEKRREDEARRAAAAGNSGAAARSRQKQVKKIPFVRVGDVSSILNTVFGSLWLGLTFLFVLPILLTMDGSGAFFAMPVFIFLMFLAASSFMLWKGTKQRGLLSRAERYIKFCGKKMYADIEDLARHMGMSVRAVKKDWKKMLKIGMFPQGHLDKQETCVMLTDEVYRQYVEADRAYQDREERKERENRPLTPEEREQEEKRRQESELNSMVAEGMNYIQKLRELNEAIPGEEISGRLSQLESLLRQIFDRVREHPEQMDRMQKLMEYYLPTTVKLVEAYVDFEKVQDPGQDIREAKEEIYKTLGIINEAFVELLNNLFQDAVFDVTTDAQVLQTMLAREGLRREMNAQPVSGGPEKNAEKIVQKEGIQKEATQEEPLMKEMSVEESAASLGLSGIGEEDPAGQVLRAPWEE